MKSDPSPANSGPSACTVEPYSKKRPFPAPVLVNRMLTGAGSPKPTAHLELSLAGSGLDYLPGDSLGVFGLNDPRAVAELLERLPFAADDEVTLPDGGSAPLREALLGTYDIRTVNKALVQKWQERSRSAELRALVERDDKAAYDEFGWGRELIDLVVGHPAEFANADEFVAVLKRLLPRLYSVASSPKIHPGEVHLTVGVVKYEARDRAQRGVCSNFLADRCEWDRPGVFVHVNKGFRLPADDTVPIVMVGPGTGVAPFRAFLEERRARAATGRNWLITGNPHRATDFLYQEEWLALLADGWLDRLDTAFSRDQAYKVYVQHRMLEAGAELWAWLQDRAYFYVCGDAERMAKDVDDALHQIAARHGGLDEQAAAAWVAGLRKDKRYQRDVYC